MTSFCFKHYGHAVCLLQSYSQRVLFSINFIHIILSFLQGIYIYFWFHRLFSQYVVEKPHMVLINNIDILFVSMYTSLNTASSISLPRVILESDWSLLQVEKPRTPQQLTFAINVSHIDVV